MLRATLWDELREQLAASQVAPRNAWAEPQLSDFRPGRFIAFDPSLSSTGWVSLRVRRPLEEVFLLDILAKGTLRVRTELTGYLATYEKTSRMRGLVEETIWRETSMLWPSVIAWEAPAVRGHRLESSLLAGYCVYEASHRAGSAVSANHASWRLTGDSSHDKDLIKAAVARYVPDSATRQWNEHERDALAIALTVSLDAPERPWVEDDDEVL